jgi:4-hydroxybutyrate CoA-transferase
MRLVLCAEGPYEPYAGVRHYLATRPADENDPVHLVFGMRRTPPPELPGLGRGLSLGTFLPGRGLRGIEEISYHRSSYSEICASLVDGSFAPCAVIACATSPGADGRRTLGAVDGYLGLALGIVEEIVIEEVAWLPRIPGAARVPDSYDLVPTDHIRHAHQAGFSDGPASAIDVAIARNVTSLIPRGATIALGIGRVNDAVAEGLAERDDIRIVTGVVTDALRLLHERGGRPGQPIEAMSVVGSDDLLDWAQDSGAVALRSSTEIHEPRWLASHDRLVSVLGAVDVDMAGNVNSERTGAKLVSGKGGAPDFARGAHESTGGRSIVALSAKHGQSRSRLIESIEDPTIPGEWIDAVATELGTAELRGLGPSQRRQALTAIF